MAFIPPPFPFPEAWPRVFDEQQQRQERRWLTPTTFAPVQWRPAEDFSSKYQTEVAMAMDSAQDEEDDDEEGEYEYGYVLSDEWRERFQATVQLQPPPKRNRPKKKKKKKPQQKKPKPQRHTVNAEAVAATRTSRSGHLQREVQAAKTRELARKWKRRSTGSSDAAEALDPQLSALETSLNMQFDEFCDAFQPVVWPHEPLQR